MADGAAPGAPSYYQRSICAVLHSVAGSYGNILLAEELATLHAIQSLSPDPQRLLLRLLLRKPGWLRLQKLEYRDIADREAALALLKDAGLVRGSERAAGGAHPLDAPEGVGELLAMLQVDELRALAKAVQVKSTAKSRDQLIGDLLDAQKSTQRRLSFLPPSRKSVAEEARERLVALSSALLGPVVRVEERVASLFKQAIGLFLLDTVPEENSLSTIILTDLNQRKYPPYSIVQSRPIFSSRDDWLAYEEAVAFEAAAAVATAETAAAPSLELDVVEGLAAAAQDRWAGQQSRDVEEDSYFLRRYTAGWVYCRSLSSLAGALERAKAYGRANEIWQALLSQERLCLGLRGRWWERLVLNLSQHLHDKAEARRFCEIALADQHVRTGSRLALQRRLGKLDGSRGAAEDLPEPDTFTIYADPEHSSRAGRKLLYLLPGGVLGSVEDLVLAHFAEEGWRGLHCESGLFRMLFTLTFWDILFGSVPDVFQTPFQSAPLDLKTDAFYPARRAQIELRLDQIAAGAAPQLLADVYYAFYGCQAVGTSWGEYPLDVLLDLCYSLRGATLSVIFRLFAEDYRSTASGMPDLILYRPDRSDYLLVEVKSPRDRLSDGQKTWNAIFARNKIKFKLCRVMDSAKQDHQRGPKRSRLAAQNGEKRQKVKPVQ